MRSERLRSIYRCIVYAVAAGVLAAGCAISQTARRSTVVDGALTMTIESQRSQPGCPVLIRIDVASDAPDVLDGKLIWRVAHGRSERSGVLALPFTVQPATAKDRVAEVSFTPARPGTYRIEARVLYQAGTTSVATLYHDVAHRWPFQSARPCDVEPATPHEASGQTRRPQ